jgi:hypothetical protein
MRTDTTQHSVLVIGRSQLVLDDTLAGLRELGYKAQATNDFFSDITGRFDPKQTDLVVFGGQVPPDRKSELTEAISAINPQVIFVQGLAGIPGLIINQIQGAFADGQLDPTRAPTFARDERSIRLTVTDPADVNVTVWWGTSFVPPDPRSDSLALLDERLASGEHAVPIPDHIPAKAVFATVHVDAAIYAFSIATEQ